MADRARLDWVDTAKGISILLVVMMYAAYSVGEDTGGVGALHYIIGFATPFRMPEFFLISGLFLSQVIDRPWRHYADRRIVHYLYFYLLWAAIHILVKTAIGSGEPVTALGAFALALVEHYGVLWFIYLLAVVSFVAKLLHSLRVPHWAALIGGAALQIAPIHTGFYALDQFAEYFVFFYAGYAFAPAIFRLVAWASARPALALSGLGVWALANFALVFLPQSTAHPVDFEMGYAALPGLRLALAIAGALAICVGAALLTKLSAMNWLRWLGAHSLIVYLSFALPMSIVRILLIKLGVFDGASVLSFVVMLAALAGPLVLYALIRWTGRGRFLFERPAWAHIPGTPGSRSATPRPQPAPAE